jgi:transglutaminase-like putative cysteine protease
MLSGLRSLGIPCRYISGYLETLPPPGKKKLVGADASHAWVSVYIPNAGWMDFDPTNNIIPSQYHVSMARGRDYHDVSPMKGVFHGYAQSQLSVSVDVAPCPLEDWPQESSQQQAQQQ